MESLKKDNAKQPIAAGESLDAKGDVITNPRSKAVECLECKRHFGSLARHLSAAHDMTVDKYRAKYGADALINPLGVKPGRKPKAVSTLVSADGDKTDDLLARASRIDLVELDGLARDGFTRLDKAMQDALLGRSREARITYAVAFEFTRRCIENPPKAEALPRWEEATVQAGTNPYYRPLKCLLLDVMSKELTSTVTQWAAIFQDADTRKLSAKDFVDELKRLGGRRAWYDQLPKPPRKDTDPPKDESPGEDQKQENAPLPAAEARALLQSQGFTDPSKPAEIMDAKTAAALLADQGAQLEPDKMSLEDARKHFAPPQALILWRADMLPAVKEMLAQMEGFVRILDLDSEEVKKVVDKTDNDR